MPESGPQTPDTINRLIGGVYPAMAMLAGRQLELFTPLGGGPMSASALAESLGVRPDKLSPLLHALVVAGLLTLEEGLFANTPEAAEFLVKGGPSYQGNGELMSDLWSATLQTAETIRTGKPQAKHDFEAMTADALRAFLRGMHGGALVKGNELAGLLNMSRSKHLADVGGGTGGLAIGACQACAQLQATVLDLPGTAAITREYIAEAGMTERVGVSHADVTRSVPGRFDIAVLRNVIQVLSAEQARRVIRNVGEALESGGTIAILGIMVDDSRLTPPRAAAFNLVFLNVYDDGCCYTESEHREWLDQAGFTDFVKQTLPDGAQIITAQKS